MGQWFRIVVKWANGPCTFFFLFDSVNILVIFTDFFTQTVFSTSLIRISMLRTKNGSHPQANYFIFRLLKETIFLKKIHIQLKKSRHAAGQGQSVPHLEFLNLTQT